MAVGKDVAIDFVAMHFVPSSAASIADMTTSQTSVRLCVPGAAGEAAAAGTAAAAWAAAGEAAAGAAERLPYVHLNQTLMNFATCHLTM